MTVVCTDSIEGGTSVNGLSVTVSGDGTHLVACTITDEGGNSTEATATVKLDTISPTVVGSTAYVTTEAAGPAGAIVTYGISASDALSGATLVCTPPSGSTFAVGETVVACTATDGAGNTASVGFTVKVTDTTPPAIVLNGGADTTAPAGTAFTDPGATATDAVDGTITVLVSGAVDPNALGIYTLTYTATDAAGNTASATRVVTVADNGAPVLTMPAPVTIEATGPDGAVASFTASASDAFSPAVPVVCSPASGSTFPLGTTNVTCSATDDAGNTSTGSVAVTVTDTTAPAITLTGDATMTVSAGSAFTDPGATATDLVDGAIAVTISGTVNTAVPGSYTVTYTAADAKGNSASATRTVTVRDTTAPVLTLPAPVAGEATGPAGAPVSYAASALDAISGAVTPACSPASGSTFPLGTTNVTCSATDAAGNTASGSFSVTVRDTIAPSSPSRRTSRSRRPGRRAHPSPTSRRRRTR